MEATKFIDIPCSGPIEGTIRIPGSKSISNRAILVAALAEGTSRIDGMLESDDTFYMTEVWKKLGVSCTKEEGLLLVQGCSGKIPACEQELYIENAGTAARFLTAALTLGQGSYILTGNERMQQRPILDLIQALQSLGCEVKDLKGTGCPPVEVLAKGLSGGEVLIPGDKSSQYISAIMLAAPYAQKETIIRVQGHLVSRTYVEMTRQLMADFGVTCEWVDEQTLRIPAAQCYQAQEFSIEGDASSASYFLGMAAVTQGKIKIKGIPRQSTQGDFGLVEILEQMGCKVTWQEDGVILEGRPLKGVTVDMNTMSDVAPTLAVIALFAEGKTTINHVGNMRIKECDRIDAVTTELKKLGAQVEQWDDGLSIQGQGDFHGAEMETYDDHRMAMSLALAGLKIPGVRILEPNCVSKTFPDFFDRFLPLIQS